MTTINLTLHLPPLLAKAAAQAGLLKPEVIEQLLREAVRQQEIQDFFKAVDTLNKADIPFMSYEAIQEEINKVRAHNVSR
jgi:hypothetical protein